MITATPASTQHKRQRLDQLVGRIAHLVGHTNKQPINNNVYHNNNNNNNNNHSSAEQRGRCLSDEDEEEDDEEDEGTASMESSIGSGESTSPQQPVMPVSRLRMRPAAMRHWPAHYAHLHPQVFSFDHVPVAAEDEEGEEEVFSPGLGLTPTFSDRLTLSPCSTTIDSPSGISFSPLSFNDDDRLTRSSDPGTPLNLSTARTLHPSSALTPPHSSPFFASPKVDLSAEIDLSNGNRRRARSDSDLCADSDRLPASTTANAPGPWVLTPATSGSLTSPSSVVKSHSGSRLEHLRPPPLTVSFKRNSSDSTDSSWSGQQESPVDLSMRSSVSSDSPNLTNTSSELSASSTPPPPLPPVSRVAKRGSRLKVLTRSLSLSQYLSNEFDAHENSDLTPPPPPPLPLLIPNTSGFGCELCGQVLESHERLVKHLSTRHKLPVPAQARPSTNETGGAVVKGYQCDVCQRPFARSDMLTRHMRLHTGLKPYTCRICGQVFSRSDHLSTHQRTHTGEKPYRCPQCSYAACRRDMITRHLRTHTRSEDLDADSRKDS